MIKKSKKNFYNRCISENKSPKYLWKSLNGITNNGYTNGNDIVIPNFIGENNHGITCDMKIINELN